MLKLSETKLEPICLDLDPKYVETTYHFVEEGTNDAIDG